MLFSHYELKLLTQSFVVEIIKYSQVKVCELQVGRVGNAWQNERERRRLLSFYRFLSHGILNEAPRLHGLLQLHKT